MRATMVARRETVMSKTPDTTGKPAPNADVKSHRAGAKKDPSRRSFLKAGGALLGGAAGAGAITGFPTIWAQEIKDIELRHVGVSYSVVKAIGDQAAKDLYHLQNGLNRVFGRYGAATLGLIVFIFHGV
jgi:hypothetical protein